LVKSIRKLPGLLSRIDVRIGNDEVKGHVETVANNARVFVDIIKEHGSFAAYLASFHTQESAAHMLRPADWEVWFPKRDQSPPAQSIPSLLRMSPISD
jgi:3-methyladenine DNA glycosylase Tag